ncbi:hypothetical protein [Clostridium sp.]|uniref:hypothetical protein n=1 Tax=Clostridium sp. TaxID=1506 RepID=UPI00262D43FB|nr:hypothetical protein [Clostridium sp.]
MEDNKEIKKIKDSKDKATEPIKDAEAIPSCEVCPINYIDNVNHIASVNFKNYGIFISLTENVKLNPNDKTIKVFYESDIGMPNFKYWIEEE